MITQTNNIVKSKPGPQPDLVFKKKVVDLYDSSFVYSYSSVARIFKITSQRVGQIHKEFVHDCSRLQINSGQTISKGGQV